MPGRPSASQSSNIAGLPAAKAWVQSARLVRLSQLSGSPVSSHLCANGTVGKIVRPKVELVTPANDAYQATAAVARPR